MKKEINIEDYVSGVLATESVDFKAIKERLSDEKTIRLLHAALGLSTEAGEILDALNKSLGEAHFTNNAKLMARYKGNKFTEEKAINRDLDNERHILEGGE